MDTKPIPQNSMKSTWRTGDRSQWTRHHWMIEFLDIFPVALDTEVPVHSKQDKVPHVSQWQLHRWILFHACIPLAIQQAYIFVTGRNLHPIAAFIFYSVMLKFIAVRQLRMLRRLGHIYGFFDGDKHERDGVPDGSVSKVVHSLTATSTFRPMMSVVLAYRTSQPPSSLTWAWLPLEIGLYGVVLDFWFYCYHRLMHDVEGFWKYHRTHHLTKHPNPLLSLYADGWQEGFDIIGIPIMAYLSLKLMGLPMGFYDWWICQQYVIFPELTGHSGLRMHAETPSTVTWLLSLFDCELVIEDHDLHHRKGWKKAHNYGKQTRLWDRLFGTCHDRIESTKENIDHVNTVTLPIF